MSQTTTTRQVKLHGLRPRDRYPDVFRLLDKLFLQQDSEVTLISLDFEYRPLHKRGINRIDQIGLSTFSTDRWRQSLSTPGSGISSRAYVMPRRVRRKFTGHRFLFGQSQSIARDDTIQLLKSVLSNRSSDGAPSKIVLVGQGLYAELDIIADLGIDLRDQKLYSIEGILISPGYIVRGLMLPCTFECPPSLGKILEYLEVPHQKWYLHNAGNDAHFALRAVLMLAATVFERMEGVSADLISDLKSIALDPIDFDSPTPDLAQKALAEKTRIDQALELAAQNTSKREPRELPGYLPDDGLDGNEEGPFGMMLFGTDD